MSAATIDPGAVAAVSFVTVAALLLVYAARHGRRRRQQLDSLMPALGLGAIEPPAAQEVLPDLLFHPNGFSGTPGTRGRWQLLRSRVLAAWRADLAGSPVLVLDVSIDRRCTDAPLSSGTSEAQVNATVIRCAPSQGPPDFLVQEHVLFKGQLSGQRAIHGVEQIGQHYFVFSDAEDSELEAWITPQLREVLTRHRLWTIAAQDQVLYLARGTTPETPGRIRSFLEEGEAILFALLH